tara:strand:- start:14 stop:877 length:864 start_codon:yes stop_codon:yes gene_type:complete
MKISFKRQFYQVLSCFFFSTLGMQIKFLSATTNIETIVFFRSLFGLLILVALIFFRYSRDKLNLFKTKDFFVQFLRAVFGTFGMFFGYKSLTLIPLAQASTISYIKVFFVAFLAYVFLKEKIRFQVFLCSIIGFLGIFIITSPEQFLSFKGSLYATISALFVAAGIIAVSFLSKKNAPTTILFYHSLFASVISCAVFFREIQFLINIFVFKYLILITLTALLGQYFNALSYKNTEANIIVLFGYSRILFSFVLGFFFLNEKLGLNFFLGFILILLSTGFVSIFLKKY